MKFPTETHVSIGLVQISSTSTQRFIHYKLKKAAIPLAGFQSFTGSCYDVSGSSGRSRWFYGHLFIGPHDIGVITVYSFQSRAYVLSKVIKSFNHAGFDVEICPIT